ncbi:hypothetical protein CHARACLAT_031607 [Characodon lateralis]|uniref:E3 ubiquitin-protein ligase RNF182 n=1 Tax=Characodon lateralis TaxID=208331 RepID=A0ABU7D5I1_9TELE|nr:hypothetical protein [Characodon lateralis]
MLVPSGTNSVFCVCCVQVQTWAQSLIYTVEELECKICYNRYNTRSRKPKLLGCLHRVCAKCLKKMVDMGDSSPTVISCPFCRHETYVPDEEVRQRRTDGRPASK